MCYDEMVLILRTITKDFNRENLILHTDIEEEIQLAVPILLQHYETVITKLHENPDCYGNNCYTIECEKRKVKQWRKNVQEMIGFGVYF